MLKLYLIRHGMTEGNRLKRYIGTTDEPLCEEGRNALLNKTFDQPEKVFVSPLLRCRQTADLYFPGMEQTVIEDLAECDFGDFENKNFKELSGNKDYQAWIDSNGTLPFPNGESREHFLERNRRGLKQVLAICESEEIHFAALVIHGGTIMNLMHVYGEPQKSFYEWHVENGCGIATEEDALEGRILLHYTGDI